MNIRNRLLIVVLIITVVIAFSFFYIRSNTVKSTLSSMLSTKINLSLSYMECFPSSVAANNNDVDGGDSISKYKLVVYSDSIECTSCNVSRMSNWKEVNQDLFFDSCRNARLIFIFSPSQGKMKEIKQIIKDSSIYWPIYLDTAYVFRSVNKQIPDNRLFHVFLLNEKDEILCVGNPLYNEKIRRMYKSVIKEGNNNYSL